MEMPDWYAVTRGPRCSGRTTVMAEATRKIKGYLIVRNRIEAHRVSHEYGLPCVGLFEAEKLRGVDGPVLFDPDAVGLICAEYDRKIYEMSGQLQKAGEDLSKALTALAQKKRSRQPKKKTRRAR